MNRKHSHVNRVERRDFGNATIHCAEERNRKRRYGVRIVDTYGCEARPPPPRPPLRGGSASEWGLYKGDKKYKNSREMRTKKIGPPVLTPKKKNKPIKKTNLLCWVGLLLALCGVIVLVIVLVSTPYPVTTFYRDEATARVNCTIGEELDDELEMCVPVHSEIAVLRNNSVKACDSFYHHVAGTWITTHKNENRAFTYVYRKNLKQVHDLIRSPESGAVYRFFRSCLDTLVNGQHVFTLL